MQEIAKRTAVMPVLDTSKVPAEITAVADMGAWVSAILKGTAYIEPDPEYISRMIAFQTITAETVEQVFASMKVRKLQDMLPNTPGATTGPIEITDLYVAASDFETGNPSYVIITATDLGLGDEYKMTTGATSVQATLIGLLLHGQWPIRCQIKRGDSKDRGGRHLLFVLPPD